MAVVRELPVSVVLVSGLEVVTVMKVLLRPALVVCTEEALLVVYSVLEVYAVLVR